MNEKEICDKVYDLVMPYVAKIEAPIAYVNMDISADSALSREKLKEAFEKVRWDTELSAADLFVEHNKRGIFPHNRAARLLSIICFEDENGRALVVPIENGEIF